MRGGCVFQGFSGDHGAGEVTQNAERPTGNCAGLF